MTPPFHRVLVANRGEIALRVIRACHELGIEVVAVYSDVDHDAPHVRAADAAELIGPAAPAASYLNVDAVLAAAQRSGAEAIHPGYGFLSENAAFARAVIAAGLVFVGPPPETMERLGNKLAARQTAVDAGVPVTPGLMVSTDDAAPADVQAIGFPLMVKAAAGGGGRGMRRVDRADDLADALALARHEAEAAFGDGTLYIERLVVGARHVEVQVLGDQHGNLAVLGERDCSIQRRHQKLVEEAPAPGLAPETRERLAVDARRVAQAVPFHNAATVEFLVDAEQHHWFGEMNTRLQVEHGVTELVTDVDIVSWQLRIAAGERLTPEVLAAEIRGHAIQARIYAEDPWDGFRPAAGRIGAWVMPDGPGIRVDSGTEADMTLPTEYDPLLAKLMVHATDRPAAVARLRQALDETAVGGVPTTLGFHRWLVDQPPFVDGRYDTSFVPEQWGDGPPLTDADRSLAASAVAAVVADPALSPAGQNDLEPALSAGAADRAWARLSREEALDR